MDNPLSKISGLIPIIEKIAADKATEMFNKLSNQAQYTVPQVPDHHHNNSDSSILGGEAVDQFQILPAITGGVANSLVLNRQTINSAVVTGLSTTIYEAPFPVIYGSGTTTAITMTGTPGISAVSATLTGAWGGASGSFATQFASGEVRNVTYSNGSTALSWTPGLLISSGSTGATLTGGARFNGGDAPYGTIIIFRNDDNGVHQIWFKSQVGAVNATWFGIDAVAGSLY
jgi:hypothetical protein